MVYPNSTAYRPCLRRAKSFVLVVRYLVVGEKKKGFKQLYMAFLTFRGPSWLAPAVPAACSAHSLFRSFESEYSLAMPAMVSAESKPIIPESVLKKRRTKEAIATKQAAKQVADQKV